MDKVCQTKQMNWKDATKEISISFFHPHEQIYFTVKLRKGNTDTYGVKNCMMSFLYITGGITLK